MLGIVSHGSVFADGDVELDEDSCPPSRKRPHEDDVCEEVYESSIMASTFTILYLFRSLSLYFDYGFVILL